MSEDSLSENVIKSIGGIDKTQTKVQYAVSGNAFFPFGNQKKVPTIPVLEAGVYVVGQTPGGEIYFEVHDVATDEILKFEDSRYNEILEEIETFWKTKSKFSEMGFTHKRGTILHGAPGTGKSCLLKQVMEGAVAKEHIVLVTKNGHTLVEGLKQFREVEKERPLLVIMEDIDATIYSYEHSLLELFDGDSQIDNVMFLATTNYINKLPARMLRPGRMDRKMEVKNPPRNGRLVYLQHKLGLHESEDLIEEFADATKDFSFAQLKEFLVGVYCLSQKPEDVIKRLHKGFEESRYSDAELRLAILTETKKDSETVSKSEEILTSIGEATKKKLIVKGKGIDSEDYEHYDNLLVGAGTGSLGQYMKYSNKESDKNTAVYYFDTKTKESWVRKVMTDIMKDVKNVSVEIK